MNTPKERSVEEMQLAQETFDAIGRYFMRPSIDAPQEMLEACDYLSNYLGDIAKNREITIDSPEEAFPTLLAQTLQAERQKREEMVEEERARTIYELTGE